MEATMHRSLNVFSGPNAVKDFLDPDSNPLVPLVELPEELNPFLGLGVHIYAKLMYLLPLLTIKSLPAFNMLLMARGAGKLEGIHTLVENSSGHTAFSLAILAGLFGIRKVVAIVPFDIAPGKLELLRLAGVQLILSKEAPDEASGITLAWEMGKQEGWLNLGQYENEANPEAAEKWVAPQIWEQLEGQLTLFCAGLGTTGTLVGASRYFRHKSSEIKIVGVTCAPESAVPGTRTEARLAEIGFDWRYALDYHVQAKTKESFKMSLGLCRAGILAGPSSGFALAGLTKFLEGHAWSGKLDKWRSPDGKVIAAFICADTPLPYLDKYSTHLDPSDF